MSTFESRTPETDLRTPVPAGTDRPAVDMRHFSFRAYRPEDEQQLVALLTRALPRWSRYADPLAVWRWKHFDNPFGRSWITVGLFDDRVIGAIAVMNWTLLRGDRHFRGARLVDFAVEPSLQGHGIARHIGAQSAITAQDGNFDLGFHTPNKKSLRMTVQTEGRRVVSILKPRVRIHRRLPLLRAWWDAWRGRQVRPPDTSRVFRSSPTPVVDWMTEHRPEIVELLDRDRARDAGRFRTQRTWDYLHWRYSSPPHLSYFVVECRDGNRLAAAAIYLVENWRGHNRLVIEDVLLADDSASWLHVLRRQLAAATKPDVVQCLMPDNRDRDLLGGWFHPAGSGFSLVVRSMTPAAGDAPFEQANWNLSLGDLREM